MTWHCSDWWRNVQNDLSRLNYDGATTDDLYSEYACNEFNSSINVTVDREDQQISSNGTDSAYCYTHDREAEWDTTTDLSDDLSRIDAIGYCDECSLWFEESDFTDHRTAEHGDEDEADEENSSSTNSFPSLRHMWTYFTP